MEWKAQYKHPLWQKARLIALEAAGYTCQRCFDSESQLNVHHKRYVKGRMIWEYSGSELEVLCSECHKESHHDKDDLGRLITMIPSDALPEIIALLAGYCKQVTGPARCSDPFEFDLKDPFTFEIGRLAGQASSSLRNVGIVDSLIRDLEQAEYSAKRVVIDIPDRKSFFDDCEQQ